jgi:class 3 adenylate cyclase
MEAERGRLLLRRFLPGALIDSAFSDPLQALGAPRSVEATVLVSDVRGFTALSETLAPTQVLELLNELQGALAGAVEDSGGVVDKFMGDGMLAVFGVHAAQPDHAQRAVQAAQRIRAAMVAYNAARPPGQQVKVGVGLHAGPLVAGLLGSGERLEFTVLGDTVNTASRVESLTKEHGVDLLLTGEVAAQLGATPLRALGEVTVRGRSQSLRLFTLDLGP